MSQSRQAPPMGRKVEIDRENQEIRATRDLRSSGGSTVLTIPDEILQSVGFEEGDQIEIQADMFGDEIRLRKSETGVSDGSDE